MNMGKEVNVKKPSFSIAVIAAGLLVNACAAHNQFSKPFELQSFHSYSLSKGTNLKSEWVSLEAIDFDKAQIGRPIKNHAFHHLRSAEQEPSTTWARLYAGPDEDSGCRIIQTRDGGFIVVGSTRSFTTYAPGIMVLKLSSQGEIEWEKIYKVEIEKVNQAFDIKETVEGGYILVGTDTQAFGIYSTGVLLIINLTQSGDVNWAKEYNYATDTGLWEEGYSIQQTSDGGFIVSGRQWQGPRGFDRDVWILKLSPSGDVEWQRSYSAIGYQPPPNDTGSNILETADGQGYIFTITTDSFNGDWTDIWLVKIDLTGEIIWQKSFGGPETETFGDYSGPFMQQAKDGKIYLVASTLSFGAHYSDVWALKLQPNGNIIWQKRYDAGYSERGVALELKDNGECVVFGITQSSQNDDPDFLVLELQSDGNIKNTPKSYGLPNAKDLLTCGIITNNQGYALLGNTINSTDNQYDMLVIKTSPTGTVSPLQDIENQVAMTVAETYCTPFDTAASTFISPDFPTPEVNVQEYTSGLTTVLVSWNLHQPPSQITIERSINRGIFYGEAINTISWQPNSYNDQFSIAEYQIFRKESQYEGELFFKFHARVPAGQYFYADEQLDKNEKYDYYITAVDSEGKESPKSAIVGNK